MKRRALLQGLIAMLGAPTAEAQHPQKLARVGYLEAVSAAADAPRAEAFRQGLRDLGYIEGQNLTVVYQYEASDFGRLSELAAELVRQMMARGEPPWTLTGGRPRPA